MRVARTRDDVGEIAGALRGRDLDVVILQPRKADDRRRLGIRIGTMHRAKGLEFAAVALVRVNEDKVPPKRLLNAAPDAAIRRSIIDGEKSLIQVSATRAKKRLFVSSGGRPSELIKHFVSPGVAGE